LVDLHHDLADRRSPSPHGAKSMIDRLDAAFDSLFDMRNHAPFCGPRHCGMKRGPEKGPRGIVKQSRFRKITQHVDVDELSLARGEDFVETLNRLVCHRSAPKYLFADNGAEFTGHLVDLWAYHHGVRIDFSRPGKPTDNAFIETFNGSLRDECLNLHWFETIAEARLLIETWRTEYNERRPHMALGNQTPLEYRLRTDHLEQTKTQTAVEN